MSNHFRKENFMFQELKNEISISTTKFIFLSIVTVGIYNLLWVYRNHEIISKKLKLEFIDDRIIMFTTFLYTIQLALPEGCHHKEAFMFGIINLILSLIILILNVIISFKAKAILEISVNQNYNINLKMNGFLTFLLGLVYINYKINSLPKIISKNKEEKEKKEEKDDEEIKEKKDDDSDKYKRMIIKFYKKGISVKELSEDFDMSEEEIEKIIK